MDIAEKRLPQDGRISLQTQNGSKVELRVSSLPTLYGEKLVLRILSKSAEHLSLDDLGFRNTDLNRYRELLKNTQGIILISGPTGSGKTTTLYATLKEINRPQTNILTIEDPIEYTLPGINQVQLKEAIGLTFPKALRAFLRQDPDVLMIGEIRDEETAQMAIRAALTGHLVLATLHTNSAWGILTRLVDMGIPPFLVTETLRLSMAQRLVRKLCPHCKQKQAAPPPHWKAPKSIRHHYTPTGCTHCYQTGYRGRTALYELLPMSPELQAVFSQASGTAHHMPEEFSFPNLRQHAWELVQKGLTSLEEVYPLIAT